MTDILEALTDGLAFVEDWMRARGYPEYAEDWCAMHGEREPDAIYATRDRIRAAIAAVRHGLTVCARGA